MLRSAVDGAIAAATAHLQQMQELDGSWAGFELAPGRSQAWTTASVALALAMVPVESGTMTAIRRAADTLHRLRGVHGWAFNSSTAADADSTAWTLRVLTEIDDLRGLDVGELLARFIDSDGRVHTFAGERFGAWSGVHADVAPVVGLALRAGGVSAPAACMPLPRAWSGNPAEAPWQAYWWDRDAYAVARNLEWLSGGPGVSASLRQQVASWLQHDATASHDAFGWAQLLDCAVAIGHPSAPAMAARLLDLQTPSGGWSPTSSLVVPPQHAGHASTFTVGGALFVSAIAVMALKRFRSA